MRRRATAVTAASLSTAAEAQASGGTGLKVGAGRSAIAIPSSLLPLDNFTTVHDDLYVRILLLESGARRVALTMLDLTSISAEAIAAIRAVISFTGTRGCPRLSPGGVRDGGPRGRGA